MTTLEVIGTILAFPIAFFCGLVVIGVATMVFGSKERNLEIRKGDSGSATIIFITGFGQPSSTWEWLFSRAIRETDTVITIDRRRLLETMEFPWFIGWVPIWYQRWEITSTFRHLIRKGLVDKEVIVVTHSVGAMLGRHLTREFPNYVKRLVQLCPVPEKWGALLFNGEFWMQGGLRSIGNAVKAFALPKLGLTTPIKATRGLFSPDDIDDASLEVYQKSLERDSTTVFLSLVLWYHLSGTRELDEAYAKGWLGDTTYVVAKRDRIFKAVDIIESRYKPSRVYHIESAHCFFLDNSAHARENSRIIGEAIYE